MRQVSKNGWRINEPGDTPGNLNESIFQGAVNCLFDNGILNPNSLMKEFRKNGISLYSGMIEELLHLDPGVLQTEDKVVPIFRLKAAKEEDEE